jgi:hypothetical protein
MQALLASTLLLAGDARDAVANAAEVKMSLGPDQLMTIDYDCPALVAFSSRRSARECKWNCN